MAKCRNCNVEILDISHFCPLCRNVLEEDKSLESMYPNGRERIRKHHLFSRIYLFIIIMIELALVLLNIILESEVWWCAITALSLLYSYLVLRYAIIGKSGHRSKAFVLILLGVLSAIAIDFVLGYRGWSINYMLPASILIMDVVLVTCILINRRSWQSYIMWLLLMLLCSLFPIALFAIRPGKYWYISLAPIVVTLSILLGVFIIGGRRSTDEIKRRFHIN